MCSDDHAPSVTETARQAGLFGKAETVGIPSNHNFIFFPAHSRRPDGRLRKWVGEPANHPSTWSSVGFVLPCTLSRSLSIVRRYSALANRDPSLVLLIVKSLCVKSMSQIVLDAKTTQAWLAVIVAARGWVNMASDRSPATIGIRTSSRSTSVVPL